MHLYVLPVIAALALRNGPETPASEAWNHLKTKREALGNFHQEFEVTRTFKTGSTSRSAKSRIILDGSQGQWREKFLTGSGNRIRIFDGKDLFTFEEGGDEYERAKQPLKNSTPLPDPYSIENPDWTKAVERERKACGFSKIEHECVVIDVPLKPWIRNVANKTLRMLQGTERVVLDTETGLVISSRTIQEIDDQRGGYQSDVTYVLARMAYGPVKQDGLFHLPSTETKEVKELSRWDAATIKQRLAEKPAPEFSFTDLQGKSITLSGFRGKTVLLDFWATWCSPCRADSPALDKLYQKYGGKDLVIVGISVDEDRQVVEKFLSEHPRQYPVVLTTENGMPRAYQIGVFPTYIVIDRDGNVSTATQGDKGFANLRKLLRKAGLETE